MSDDLTQVYCRDCGHMLFEGEWTQEEADRAAARPKCPECGSSAREYKMAFTVTARASVSYGAELIEPGHSSRRKATAQKQVGGEFARGDGRGYVDRAMVISKRPPRFKWHRVDDVRTGEVEKNLLERHDDETGKPTGERWDFRDPDVEPPEWFPHDPRAE